MKKLLIVACALVATASFAQETDPVRLDVRGGIQFPITGDLSGTFFGLGADVTFDRTLIRGSETFLSVDWVTKSTKNTRNNMFPIMLNQRWNLGMQDMGGNNALSTYVFAGVGLAILDFGNAATVIAGRGGIGADFSPNVFGEAVVVITGRSRGTNVNGHHIGLYLGYRF